MSIFVATTITVGDILRIETQWLMFINCSYHKNMGCFTFYYVLLLKVWNKFLSSCKKVLITPRQ